MCYLLTPNELIIANIENVTHPEETVRVSTGGQIMENVKNFLYIGSGDSLIILKVTDSLEIIHYNMDSTLRFGGWIGNIVHYNNLLFIAKRDKVFILDITNPISPRLLSSFEEDMGWFYPMEINYPYLYVGERLNIYDISDPSKPQLIGSSQCIDKRKTFRGESSVFEYGDCGDLELTGNYLLARAMSGPYAGLVVCDVSAQDTVLEIGYSLGRGEGFSPVRKGSYVYTQGGNDPGWISVYDISNINIIKKEAR